MKDDIDYEDFELSEEDESDVDPDEPLKSKRSYKEMTFDDFIHKQFDFMAAFSIGFLMVLAFIIYLPFLLLSTTGFAFYKMFKKGF
ncbi:hypothetical protein EWQ66_22970 [Salmonella enterica]|nr:hypothetical protein [Salmonella enterica]ECV4477870.1 hypothetical protein [Salmonella enterica subsp. enterica serovar Braenderup]EBR6962792.1 hypothetical protein [Salmonella enterica]EBT0217554.1 hypothetical protein [Salmonella enterica]EDE9162770.1 hypothetical protein [Salmonella enterica]